MDIEATIEQAERDLGIDPLLANLRDKMSDSAAVVLLFSPSYGTDFKSLVELAMAIMLDKKIGLIVKMGTPIPEHIRKVSTVLGKYSDKEDLSKLANKVMEFMEWEEA